MLIRRLQKHLPALLEEFPAVALLGPRQVDKTTLALELVKDMDPVYLELDSARNRVKLSDPELYLAVEGGVDGEWIWRGRQDD